MHLGGLGRVFFVEEKSDSESACWCHLCWIGALYIHIVAVIQSHSLLAEAIVQTSIAEQLSFMDMS